MPGVDLGLFAIVLDDQLIVPIRLHVELALAREADDLHRDLLRDSVVEKQRAVEVADLRALVADERTAEPEPFHPRQGAGERSSRAGDHRDAGRDQAMHCLHVAWVELEMQTEDCAVQVQREQAVTKCERYRLTSGLTRLGGRPPRTAVAMLRAAIADISERVRTVALAMWGASTTFGIWSRPGWTAGSRS